MRLIAALGLAMLATPALAIDSGAATVTCTGAVTTGIGGKQELRDLTPSDLPVLAYAELPRDRQFKQLAKIGDEAIRLYVYRVNEQVLHMQIFALDGDGKDVLADTPMAGEVAELTWAPLGGDEMVTAYCY